MVSRNIVTVSDHLPKNFALIDFLELVHDSEELRVEQDAKRAAAAIKVVKCDECGTADAVSWCEKCDAVFCQQHAEANHQSVVMRKHSIVPIAQKNANGGGGGGGNAAVVAPPFCVPHHQPMVFWCTDCKVQQNTKSAAEQLRMHTLFFSHFCFVSILCLCLSCSC